MDSLMFGPNIPPTAVALFPLFPSPAPFSSSGPPPSPILPSTLFSKLLLNKLLIFILRKQMVEAAAESRALEQAKLAEKEAIELALKLEKEQKGPQLAIVAERAAYFDENGELDQNVSVDSSHLPILLDNNGEEVEHFLTRCGITWRHLTTVNSQLEFDDLRRRHQVSKNRNVAYGVRYACTRNAKVRDNCPYLMLSMPSADGRVKVFYRNSHTHPIRYIRNRE